MFLIINTAMGKSLEVILAKNNDDFNIKEIEGEYKQAENLLPLIGESLNNWQKKISDITGIAVVTGPGGFTALRIGVVTANVLAYALDIPVIGLTLNEFKNNRQLVAQAINKLKNAKSGGVVVPEYGREPNITVSPKHQNIKTRR
ncbi:MAG: tRNA (adenosine(37)-N6)-threonylcarbamoyltransferase complex dimerization subunit type 1 TsaB [Patescibacteria group bacterium]